jgi:hypothetical protein
MAKTFSIPIQTMTEGIPDRAVDFILDDHQTVEVTLAADKLWINIDGQCVVRVSKAKEVVLEDRRGPPSPVDEEQTPYQAEP